MPKQLETELRRTALDRMAKAQLPRVVPVQMWGGKGSGRLCALCQKTIGTDEIELEVEWRIDCEHARLPFHVACHSLWRFECGRDAWKMPEDQGTTRL